ncbi:SET domain-containing protein [Pseudovirgaria hyperparasitica]|uniref:SET domain-containing protein n=1 Tax=Pseudovirgaria hyperparasitica TaxID=470096 RepID=A0A6A6WME1_9PEZI|nr:SET domain-containing protein [Pseudovirgaria hyperparasitica]KAF2763323.1 SET domain-containing protein [Pseudovirgaria hyperparasitica]
MATDSQRRQNSVASADDSCASSACTASTSLTPSSPAHIIPASNGATKKKRNNKSRNKKKKAIDSSQTAVLSTPISTPRLFEIKKTPNRGLGVFATQDLPRGTRIMTDTPIIRIEGSECGEDEVMDAYDKLDAFDQAQLLTLEKHFRAEHHDIMHLIRKVTISNFEEAKARLESLLYDDSVQIREITDPETETETETNSRRLADMGIDEIADAEADTFVAPGIDPTVTTTTSHTDFQIPQGVQVINLEDSDAETIKDDTTVSDIDSDSSAEIAREIRHKYRSPYPRDIPILTFPAANARCPREADILRMTSAQRSTALANVKKELAILEAQDERRDICAIVLMNHFVLRDQSVSVDDPKPFIAVCLSAARLNNDCTPNANNLYNSSLGAMTVHAVRNIKAGEEITIAYTNSLYGAKERNIRCFQRTDMHCDCKACEKTDDGLRLDERRKIMNNNTIYLQYYLRDDHLDGRNLDGHDIMKRGNELIRLMTEDGLWGSHLAQARNYQARICAKMGLRKLAIMHAGKAIEEARVALGDDNPEFQYTKAAMEMIIAGGGREPIAASKAVGGDDVRSGASDEGDGVKGKENEMGGGKMTAAKKTKSKAKNLSWVKHVLEQRKKAEEEEQALARGESAGQGERVLFVMTEMGE